MQSGGRYCPNCGSSLSHDARFCPNCGQDQSPNATIIGDAEATSSVPPDSNMSMTQQTVPPQGQQSLKGFSPSLCSCLRLLSP
jgi:predicted amidophosphoribosyltransferase